MEGTTPLWWLGEPDQYGYVSLHWRGFNGQALELPLGRKEEVHATFIDWLVSMDHWEGHQP